MGSTTRRPPDAKSQGLSTTADAVFGRRHGNQFLAEIEAHAPWEVWAEKLANRKRPVSLRRLVRSDVNPLEWSVGAEGEGNGTFELLHLLDGLKRHWHDNEPADWSAVVRDWLTSANTQEITLSFALECLGWSHALSRLAIRLPAENWWDLFAFLLNTAVESTEVFRSDIEWPDEALLSQLLAGEFPLTLAYCFPRVEVCTALAPKSRKAITDGMIAVLDGEGMPHARYVPVWRSLVACWTRCMYFDQEVRGGRIKRKARLQYEWLVRQSLRWLRADGQLVFENGSSRRPQGDSLLRSALSIGGDEVDHEVYQCILGKKKPRQSQFDLPAPSEHSEWGEAAVMRASWSPKSTHLGVTFHSSKLVTELVEADQVIWSGEDLLEIQFDHEPLRAVSEWEELCWSSDDDIDYIELEMRFSNNCLLQRQILFAHSDGFLLLADALVGNRTGKIEYCRSLPIRKGIERKPSDETTEVGLRAKHNIGWMMPLALSEWKADRSVGQFDGITLRQQTLGQSLYAPLFIDLCANRKRKARTWRQLTVGSQLDLVARDKAVAYRVQCGQDQWVIYRSLAPAESRTFIGQNVSCEFLVARFSRDGEIEELIEIE